MDHQDNIDFAIMTAVDDEHQAVINAFGFCHKDKVQVDKRIYWQKNIRTKMGNDCSLVIAQSLDMANVSSAILANNIIHHFHPKVIFLVGVCAGRENKVEKGDIILAEDVYYYERGKQTEKGFEPEPKMHSADAGLIDLIRSLPKTIIPNCKTHDGSMKRPKVVRGVIGCGEKVIEDPESWNQLLRNHRKIVAIEMESHGLASVIWENSQNSKFIVIKAVMDYGIPPKDDRWKPFAAKAAALYVKNIVYRDPFYPQNRTAPIKEESKIPPKGKLADLGNLPLGSRLNFIRNSNFTGRESDLLELANHFLYRPKTKNNTDFSGIFLTSGIGGIGKTQLAIEFCFRYGRFFQGIHWIQADQDIEPQIADCGYRMGLTPWPEELSDQVNLTIRTWEADNNRLIVFDNLESSEILQKWIPKLRGMRILATSRRDQWPSEMNITTLPINVLNKIESREFLRNIAPRLNRVDDQVVDTLSDRLGYLPLALYLAANYLNERKTFSVEQFLKELDERGKGISHTALTNWRQEIGPTHHVQNIIATFDMSWARLGESAEDKTAKNMAIAAGYCAPNIPIPLSIFYELQEEGNIEIVDKALNRLYQVGLLLSGSQSLPYIHPLIAEYSRLQIESNEDLKKLLEVFITLSNKALSTKLPEAMHPILEHLKQIIHYTDSGDFPETGVLYGNLGVSLRQLAQFKDALFYLERAMEIKTKAYGEDHPTVATGLNNLAGVLRQLGDLAGAKQRFERAMEIKTKAYGEDHPTVATGLNNLAGVLRQLGDLAGAKQRYERALEIDTKAYGEDHPTVAIGLNNLAGVLQDLGDLAGAKQRYERALEIDTKVYGGDHPTVAIDMNNLAGVLQDLGDLAGAKQRYERALEITTKAYGEDHPTVATGLNNLAGVLQDLGDLAGAKQRYERALEITTKVYGEDHPTVATRLNNLAGVLQDLGDLAGAKQRYERALEIKTKAYGEDHPTVAIGLNNLAGVLRQLGDLAGAKQRYERALWILKHSLPFNHPNIRLIEKNLKQMENN